MRIEVIDDQQRIDRRHEIIGKHFAIWRGHCAGRGRWQGSRPESIDVVDDGQRVIRRDVAVIIHVEFVR